jgi:hypothetical protein
MSWLIATSGQRSAAGVDVPDIDRIDRHMLLAKLIYTIGRLHRQGWVYGDLSFKNVAFALTPPRIMVLDCDGAARMSDPSRQQAHTPFWNPPECTSPQDLQDQKTDVYKLGLAVLRCLTPGKGAASTRDPARLTTQLDATGIALVRRALSKNPADRPTAKELYVDLQRMLRGRISEPAINYATLTTPIRLRGRDVEIEWDIERADEIVVHAANGQRFSFDADDVPYGVSFCPAASGPVVVEARNRFGPTFEELEDEVTLYDLPRFDIGDVRLPRPVFTGLSAVALHAPAAVIGTRPVANVGTEVVAPPSPDLVDLIADVKPSGQSLPSLPRLDEPVFDAAGVIRNSVMNAGAELATTVGEATALAAMNLTKRGRSL